MREDARTRPWLAVGREIADALRLVDGPSFERLLSEFSATDRRWFFVGQGRSGLVARMAAMRLMHLGLEVHAQGEATTPAIDAQDRCVCVSGSGRTPTTLHHARIARDLGARVIAVTADATAPLAELADVTLIVPIPRTAQFGGSLFEQVALACLDAVVLASSGTDRDVHERMRMRHANLE